MGSSSLARIAIDTETAYNKPFLGSSCDEQLNEGVYSISVLKDYIELKRICEDENIVKVFHGAPTDIFWLSNIGIKTKGKLECTLIMANLVDENFEAKNLKKLAVKLFNADISDEVIMKKYMQKAKKQAKKDKINFTWDLINRDAMIKYAGKDATRTIELFYYFLSPIKKFMKIYEFEKSLIPIIVKMDQFGMRIDRSYVKKQLTLCEDKSTEMYENLLNILNDNQIKFYTGVLRKTERGFYNYIARNGIDIIEDSLVMEHKYFYGKYEIPFNPNSYLHISNCLLRLGVNLPTSGKADTPSADASILKEKLKENISTFAHNFIDNLLRYKYYNHQITHYYYPLYCDYTSEENDRGHFIYYQTGAKTGRFSAKLIQTIPRNDESIYGDERNIRKAFIPAKDCLFVSIDYSQIEFRLFAHFANATNLIKDINNGLDVHTATAYQIFGKEKTDRDKKYRRQAKTINFGLIYGMGVNKLADTLTLSLFETNKILAVYYKAYPVREFIKTMISLLHRQGYITLDLHSPLMNIYREYRVPKRLAYKAVNVKVQGCCAYVMKYGMKRASDFIHKEKLGVKLISTIHDELIFEVHKNEYCLDLVRTLVHKMEDTITFKVPMNATVKVSDKSWGEAKDIAL